MQRFTNNLLWLIVLCAIILLLAGCNSGEQAEAHVAKAESLYLDGNFPDSKLELRNALTIDPENAKARYLMALINDREKDVKNAIGNLRAAIAADPDFIDPYIRLGNYYVAGRKTEPALIMAARALEIDPENAAAHLLNARVKLLTKQPDEALDAARQAMALDNKLYPAITLTALLYARRNQLDIALNLLDNEISKTTDAGLLTTAQYLHNVSSTIILDELNDPAQIEKALWQQTRKYPGISGYRIALVKLYLRQAKAGKAENVLRELLAHEPENTGWRISLAILLERQQQPEAAKQILLQGLDLAPDANPLKFALASWYEAYRQREEAAAIYTAIASIDPVSEAGLTARNHLARLNIDIDDEKADEIIAGILSDDPRNLDALLYKAAIRLENRQPDQAIATLRSALNKHPESKRALLTLARIYALQGDRANAELTYGKLLGIDPYHKQALNERGALAGAYGDNEDAEALLRESLRVNPNDPYASRNLINTLLVQQDYRAAETEARRMSALGENSGVARYQLGLALEKQGQLTQAMDAYRQALAENPAIADALIRLINLMVNNAQIVEAESTLRQHIDQNPQDSSAQILLAELLESTSRPADAQAMYEQVITQNPTPAAAYMGLASLFPVDSPERIAVLIRGVSANPADSVLSLALGTTYTKTQAYEKAIQTYEQALQSQDNDMIAANLAALLLDIRNDKNSRQQALRLAMRFAAGPQHPLSLGVLGWAYYNNANYIDAARYLEQAVAGNDQIPQLRYYLGMAYLKAGDNVGARQELETAIKLAGTTNTSLSGFKEAQEALARLNESQ